ncbi:uncharacterized protein LOC117653900 isoform X2 [Thrips palmi]|uniref:Uncharacterized protein LOC117653900 isoform X2 n=1 Tax=Thrips palmi TaxID=161013 RepID=A0A6P9AEN4_THRPL|nr:uncharacterized protein LOC117653900 isoform X2 [Thrips palmi]
MNSSSECGLCYNRYDDTVRIPKNLSCGHVKCLECLNRTKLTQRQMNRPLKCPECAVLILVEPVDLTTNYTILQEASGVANQFHCDRCNKVADWECEKNGHSLRGLWAHRALQTESSRKAVDAWSAVLEKVVPKVLQMKDIAEEQLQETLVSQSKANQLTQRLSAFINGRAGPGADQEGAMRDAGECSLRLPPLQRGAKFMELDKGSVRFEVQDGGEIWAANLDMGSGSTVKPEVLSVAQFLMFLLCKEGYMQKQEQGQNHLSRAVKDLKLTGDKAPKPKGPSPAVNVQGQQGQQGQGQQGPRGRQPAQPAPAWTITDDGVLDLSPSGVGGAPLGPQDKAAILKSTKLVTHLIAHKCNEDPDFYTNVIVKHAPYIEKLELRQVHQSHLHMLGSMRMLTDLKLLNYVGKVSVGMSAQPGCVLRSLFVKLPTNVQFDLWEAYASSLSNIVMRIEVSSLGIHTRVRAMVAKTPNLRTLVLSRYNSAEHTPEECAKQLGLISSLIHNGIKVSCSICAANTPL